MIYDIVISYSRKDGDIVQSINERLTQKMEDDVC